MLTKVSFSVTNEETSAVDAVLHLVQRALIYLGMDATTEPRRAIFQQCKRFIRGAIDKTLRLAQAIEGKPEFAECRKLLCMLQLHAKSKGVIWIRCIMDPTKNGLSHLRSKSADLHWAGN